MAKDMTTSIRAPSFDGSLRSGSVSSKAAKHARVLPPIVLIYLVTVMLPLGFQVGPIYMTLLRLVSLLITGPLLVMLLTGKLGRIMIIDVFFLLHVAWAFVAILVNNPDRAVEFTGSFGTEFLGGYLLARAKIKTREQFVAMFKVILLFTIATLPLAIFESQTGNPIIINTINSLPGLRSETVAYEDWRLGMARSQVVFGHPISYGIFCSLAFSLTFVAMQGHMPNRRRLIATGLVMVCTFFSLSAGAILPVLMQLMLLGWFIVFKRLQWRWMLLMWIAAVAYIAIDLASERTPLRVFMSYATFSPHNAYYRTVINEWGMYNLFGNHELGVEPNPIFGLGLNDWARPWWMHSASIDNFWLLAAMRYGVPGFLLLAIGYGSLLIQVTIRNFRSDPDLDRIRLAWIFTFVGLTFSLITVHIWSAAFSYVFFLLGAGAWIVHAQPRNGEEEPSPDDGADQTSGPVVNQYSRFPPRDIHAS